MSKTKLIVIKPSLGFVGISDTDLILRLNAVHDGMLNNPAFPTPPVDMPTFKTAIDSFTTAAAAMLDGGKSATIERDKRRGEVIAMLRLLGHYVEANSKNDLSTFASSGFDPIPTAQRTPAQPVSAPPIKSVTPGIPGQLLVLWNSMDGAAFYVVRGAQSPAAGATANWTEQTVVGTRPATPFDNLTPGTKYTFQVRAYGKLGFSEWSDPVERMCN
jgi:hypothetical protein